MAYTEFYVSNGGGLENALNAGAPLGANDGPVYSTADATVAAGTPTVITDNSGSDWAGASVGDWVRWDTAGAKELRRITDITGAAATVQTACTAGANKAVRVGGAIDTVDGALSLFTKDDRNADDDPPRINVKAGTAYVEDCTTDAAGSANYPITLQGYTTTPGDGGEAEIQGKLVASQNFMLFKDLYINAAAAGDNIAVEATGTRQIFRNIRGRSTGATNPCFKVNGTQQAFIACQVVSSADTGFETAGLGTVRRFFGCIANNCTNEAFLAPTDAMFVNCIANAPGSDCFSVTAGSHTSPIINCIGYGSTAGAGVKFSPGANQLIIYNCIFAENNQYGLEADVAKYLFEDYNAFYNNGAGERANAHDIIGLNDITLSGDPFVDASNGDFRINPLSIGGIELRAAGFPGALNGTNVGFADIGALPLSAVANTVRRFTV